MNRFVSTMASIAMTQAATIPATTQPTATQVTIAMETEMTTFGGEGIIGDSTGSDTGNWMVEYEKFFNDENNFDYQGFLKNLKTDEKDDFMSFVTSNVILE